MKKIMIVSLMLCMFFVRSSFAATVSHKDIFSLTMPEGWTSEEVTEGAVSGVILNAADGEIAFTTQCMESMLPEGADLKEALAANTKTVTELAVTPEGGEVIKDEATTIFGVPAQRLEYTIEEEGVLGHAVYITFIKNNYIFTVAYGAEEGNDALLQTNETILKSLKF